MSNIQCVVLAIFISFFLACSSDTTSEATERPNVLFIICDDLNDYNADLQGYPSIVTPGIDQLASSAVSFQNAHTNVGLCQPSRNSLFTGIYPHTSKDFGWTPHFKNPLLQNRKTFVELFKENGYQTLGTGKLLHREVDSLWTEWGVDRRINYGPHASDGSGLIGHPSVPEPFRSINNVDGSFASLEDNPRNYGNDSAGWTYGPYPFNYQDDSSRDLMPDELHANWAIDKIRELEESEDNSPFFLGVGFVKPHTPLYAPQKYFDQFPLDSIQLPVRMDNDVEDAYYSTVYPESDVGLYYYSMLMESYPNGDDGLRLFMQAYLACVAFVDDQIAAVLDALDNSKFRDNTIVILTSDHGWQMGEKEYLYKNSPWDESTRIPLIVRDPRKNNTGFKVNHPVSLIDIYPTLVDLCNLEGSTTTNQDTLSTEGFSLTPFLEDSKNKTWDGPDGALTLLGSGINTPIEGLGFSSNPNALWHIEIMKELDDSFVLQQNYSYRTERWRYIRYNNGREELYDHENDPYEWYNLSDKEAYKEELEKLRGIVLDIISKHL
jgi:arylsulfatase A-like enzyme